jgi:hypothetical protein
MHSHPDPHQPDLSPRNALWIKAAGVAVIAWTAFATLVGHYRALGPAGLDPSWRWAVNQAHEAGWIFGRDIVFTYGPLAFLMWPLDISSNLLIANLFLLIVQVIFALSLTFIFLREKSLPPLFSFTLLYMVAFATGLQVEGFLLIVTGLLVLIAVTENLSLPLALASSISAILTMVKMSLGVAATIILAAGIVTALFAFRRPSRFLVPLLGFPLTLVALATVYFDSGSSFMLWLSNSLEIVSGYSEANSVIGPSSQTLIGVAVVASWFAAMVLVRRDPRLLSWFLIMAPVVLIQFRLAFVRQDGHQLQFLPFVLTAVGVSALLNRRLTALGAHCAVAVLLLTVGALSGLSQLFAMGRSPAEVVTGGCGRAAISNLIHFRETRDRLAVESESNLESLQLPEAWNKILRGSRNGLGILPWEIQYCPANDLQWNPTPTLQLYSAYTRSLDLHSARHYSSDAAPQFIINELTPVGDRHQMLDAPATWRALLVHYRARDEWVESGMGGVLLERRASRPQIFYEEFAQSNLVLEGPAIRVPRSDHLAFAELDVRLNALGRLQKSLFRVPKIDIVMHHASGHISTRRLVPGTAINGVLINRFPRDGVGYIKLWQGLPDDPVIRFSISGPGSPLFHRTISLTWRNLEFFAPTEPSPGVPPRTGPQGTSPGSGGSQ